MASRGSYGFEFSPTTGRITNSTANLERLRTLFRDGSLIQEQWGPGDPGDFDHGAWHILCHLAGAAGVLRTRDGIAWCGITHRGEGDRYEASLIVREGGAPVQFAVESDAAQLRLNAAECLGYIEGSSLGRISARGIHDAPGAFNNWPRQKFDQAPDSDQDGGLVWEHWSTTRDLRPTCAIGNAVLGAYLALLSVLGGRFCAAVARGRREHSHPEQLVALVRAGLLTADEAMWEIQPEPIPLPVQQQLYRSEPAAWLEAAEALFARSAPPNYFMFARRIDRWSPTAAVRRDLGL